MKTFSTVAAVISVILVLILFFAVTGLDSMFLSPAPSEEESVDETTPAESNDTVLQTVRVPANTVEQTVTVP